MGYTQWLLVQQSDLTFRFVTERRYADFWAGRGTLPQAQPGEVRTVEVVLHLEQRTAGEVIHVDHRRYPVVANGRRDPASRESELALIRDIVGMSSSTRPESARRRWATRQIERTFRWTPTAREAKEIADLVSRRAKTPLLGGRPLRLVESELVDGADHIPGDGAERRGATPTSSRREKRAPLRRSEARPERL